MNEILLYSVLLIMTILGSIASLFLKKASGKVAMIDMMKEKYLYLGGGLYGLSAILNVILLRYIDYSIVLPLTSITYIWTLVISYYFLKEKINKRKVISIMLIVFGAIIISV